MFESEQEKARELESATHKALHGRIEEIEEATETHIHEVGAAPATKAPDVSEKTA